MSVLTILTLIFIVLKLTDVIDWSWWLVLTPTIIYVVLWTLTIGSAAFAEARRDKRFDDWRHRMGRW